MKTPCKKYFAYKTVANTLALLLISVLAASSFTGIITRRHPDPEGLMLFLILLISGIFLFIVLFHMAFFHIPAARFNEEYFSIKKTLFHPAKRIQLKDISDIKYDGDYLHITYTHDAQQVSDIFDLSRLFYEDTIRCLIYDLNEALNKYGVAAQYKNRMGAEHENHNS